ncbi:hypothetical protein BT96DRAFT_952017 [Gymnopus androsaceus JB14]|uniref:Uncharacterized protein n=1 Tax=Gymnopus androsaceus JB14 TaxID=1447944 RepID=A0A6A4GBA8_9AGAR|nr:hypothetical protein BT96DRAFT_952017 [Gymnopus androsaceus JB14]
MVLQNNEQIAGYVDSVNPIPRSFVPPPKLKTRDLKVDTGELHEEDLGKRYWLVRQSTPLGPRSRKVYSNLPGLWDIDKTLFSKGTLGTLLSYREMLNARIGNQASQEYLEPEAEHRAVSLTPEDLPGEKNLGCITLRFFLEDGMASEELYTTPRAGRIVLKKLKLRLGSLGVEAVDSFEVSRKGKLDWKAVQWTSPIPAQAGDVVFFRKVGVTHMPGWDIDRHYL